MVGNKNILKKTSVKPFLIAIGIGVLTFIVYLPVVYHGFIIYDDPDYITLNPYVLKGFTADGIKWAFTQLHGEKTYWHPLTWLSHMLDCQLFGPKPGIHHLINVFYHIINSFLVFALILKLTGSLGKSAMISVLFALHPVQVETVAWISERKNLLTTLFALLSLLAYMKYSKTLKTKFYVLTIVLFMFCLMAKPALTPLPFLILVLDFYPLRRIKSTRQKNLTNTQCVQVCLKRAILEKIPLFIVMSVSCAITIFAHKSIGGIVHTMPLSMRIENAIVAYATYVEKAIVPSGFAIIYPHPGIWERTIVYGSSILLILVSIYVLGYRRRDAMPLIGWLWFLGMLVPVSGIIQAGVQSMALRFVYFPIIGLFITIVWTIGKVLDKIKMPVGKIVGGIVICICIVLSSNQLRVWQDNLTLFEQALKNTKNNFIAHCNYGLSLYYRGNLSEAKEHILDALRIYPRFVEARLNLGMVFEKEGDFSSAAEQYKRAIEIRPDLPFGWKSLAQVLNQLGQNEDALKAALVAEKINPNDPDLQFMLGYLSSRNNMPHDAIMHYRKALAINPNQPAVLNNLAWLLSTLPDDSLRNGKEAVELAEKANALIGGENVTILGTLAAAYAEANRFDDAIATAQKAIQLAEATNQKELAEKNAKLLKLYSELKPYRESVGK